MPARSRCSVNVSWDLDHGNSAAVAVCSLPGPPIRLHHSRARSVSSRALSGAAWGRLWEAAPASGPGARLWCSVAGPQGTGVWQRRCFECQVLSVIVSLRGDRSPGGRRGSLGDAGGETDREEVSRGASGCAHACVRSCLCIGGRVGRDGRGPRAPLRQLKARVHLWG